MLLITYYKGEAKCIRNLFTFLKIFVFNIYLVHLSPVVLFFMLEFFFFCYYYLYNCSLLSYHLKIKNILLPTTTC